MYKRLLLASYFASLCLAAHALETPFAWPESYSYTTRMSSKTHPENIFINHYNRDDLKARNESPKLGILILRLDEHKKIHIKPDGSKEETTLPAEWPMSNIFPKDRPWEKQATDTIRGKAAIKYKIARDPSMAAANGHAPYVLFWLSDDLKTPLRMEDGDIVLEFYNYLVGSQDPKLFEIPK